MVGSDEPGEPLTATLVSGDGHETELAIDPDETIVDAADAAGVSVPYGCLYGVCGTCTVRVLEGELAHREPPRALNADALERGYVLGCIATPQTDCRLRVGHEVQAEAVGTPWK